MCREIEIEVGSTFSILCLPGHGDTCTNNGHFMQPSYHLKVKEGSLSSATLGRVQCSFSTLNGSCNASMIEYSLEDVTSRDRGLGSPCLFIDRSSGGVRSSDTSLDGPCGGTIRGVAKCLVSGHMLDMANVTVRVFRVGPLNYSLVGPFDNTSAIEQPRLLVQGRSKVIIARPYESTPVGSTLADVLLTDTGLHAEDEPISLVASASGCVSSPSLVGFNISRPDFNSLLVQVIVARQLRWVSTSSNTFRCYFRAESRSGEKSTFIQISGNISDTNDHPPRFLVTEQDLTVYDNVTTGVVLATPTCVDDDNGAKFRTSLRITRGNEDGVFSLNDSTSASYLNRRLNPQEYGTVSRGKLAVFQRLPWQPNPRHIEVTCFDDPQSNNGTFLATMRINLNIIAWGYKFSPAVSRHVKIPENSPRGHVVFECKTVCASAEGCKDYPEPTIRLTEGNTGTIFLFNAPWLTVQKGLDRETTSFYRLKFQISGESEDVMFLDIRVSDVSDNSPFIGAFNQTNRIFIPSNAPINTSIAEINVSNSDVGQNGNVSLALEDSLNASFFQLLPSRALVLVRNVDHLRGKSLDAFLNATDHGQPSLSTVRQFTVTIDSKLHNVMKVSYMCVCLLWFQCWCCKNGIKMFSTTNIV